MYPSQYHYLSANFGLLTIDGHDVFALSALSPIGQAMLGKTVGDTYDFRDQKFSIQKIA
jgi:transcription elongation GreA/GreB family factor